jgi:hypothetical protein
MTPLRRRMTEDLILRNRSPRRSASISTGAPTSPGTSTPRPNTSGPTTSAPTCSTWSRSDRPPGTSTSRPAWRSSSSTPSPWSGIVSLPPSPAPRRPSHSPSSSARTRWHASSTRCRTGRHGPDRPRSDHAAGPRSDGDRALSLSSVWRGADGRGRGIPADAPGRGDHSGPRTVPDP